MEAREQTIKQLTVDSRRVEIVGLYTTGEGTETPGDDGYDLWLLDDPAGQPYTDAQHINEGEIFYELPTEAEIREWIGYFDAALD
jgi:hypothetical protein